MLDAELASNMHSRNESDRWRNAIVPIRAVERVQCLNEALEVQIPRYSSLLQHKETSVLQRLFVR
jgi:hypothetical protein